MWVLVHMLIIYTSTRLFKLASLEIKRMWTACLCIVYTHCREYAKDKEAKCQEVQSGEAEVNSAGEPTGYE